MKKYITQAEIGKIDEVISTINPGDELIFEDTIFYLDRQITIECNGTLENPIIIGGLDFEHRPIFDFRNQPYGVQTEPDCNGFRIIGSNLVIQNMIIRYSGFKGLKLETKDTTIKNIETYGCCDSGIHIVSGGNNKVINCDSHDNFGYKKSKNKVRVMPFGFSSDGISDKLHDGDPDIFIDCRSWNNTDDGFDFYARECENGEIELHNCWSFNNGKSSFNLTDYPRYNVDEEWFKGFINGFQVEDQFATIDKYPAFGNGNGFKLGGAKRNTNISLFSCSAVANKGKGFDQNKNTGNMVLNECYGADNKIVDYGFRFRPSGSLTLRDCESKGKCNFLCDTIKIGENNFNNGEDTKYLTEDLARPRDKYGNLPKI
jgi:hypothetical protein